jgi:hypothetical protein
MNERNSWNTLIASWEKEKGMERRHSGRRMQEEHNKKGDGGGRKMIPSLYYGKGHLLWSVKKGEERKKGTGGRGGGMWYIIKPVWHSTTISI